MALNVGTGVGSSVQEVIDATERVTGREVPAGLRRPPAWRPCGLFSNNDLVRSTLGWEPAQQLDEIIATAWQWHSTHVDQ